MTDSAIALQASMNVQSHRDTLVELPDDTSKPRVKGWVPDIAEFRQYPTLGPTLKVVL